MITSPSNPKLRYVRRLGGRAFRARERRLVIEGARLVGDALDARADFGFVLVAGEDAPPGPVAAVRARLVEAGVPVADVAPEVLAGVCQTEAPQGIVAVAAWPELPLPAAADLVLVVDGMRDPGNLGATLRTAAAAGVDAVLLAPGTVDATNPKVLRAAMGAHFRVPLRALAWPEVAAFVGSPSTGPLAAWLADAGGSVSYTAVDWTAPSALIVGAEAHGPSVDARRLASGAVRILMPGGMESLNAATAAAVILFEAVRQRAMARMG